MGGVTRAFTGLVGDDWFTAANWASTDFTIAVPGAEDAVTVDSATTEGVPATIENGDAQADSIEISQGNQVLVGSDGTLTVGSAINLVGFATDEVIIQNGSTVTVQNGGGITIGENGAGRSGGGALIIGGQNGSGNGADGGTLNAAGVVLNTLGSQVRFNVTSGKTYTFSVAMSSDGGVLQEGVGSLVILTGDNSYSGTTTISAGILEIGDGGTSGSLGTGQVDDNFALEFNLSTPTAIANVITGTGAVSFFGPNSYSLSGASSFSGELTVNAGVNLGLVGGVTLGNGAISDLGLLEINPTSSLTLSNAISGAGALMLFVDDLTLSGADTYLGKTTVGGNEVQTILHAGGDDDFSVNSDVDLEGDSFLDLNGFDDSIGGLTGLGVVDNLVARSAKLTIVQAAATESYSGQIQNEGGELDLVFSATVALNTLVYTGNDIATGSTTVNQGVLQVGAGGTSGALNSNPITIDANGTLVFDLSNGAGLSNTLSGSGNLTFEGGGPNFILVNETGFTGKVTVASGTRLDLGDASSVGSLGSAAIVDNGELDLNHSGTFTFDDAISGTGEVLVYGGTEVLKAGASYSGETEILTNTLMAGAANVLSKYSVVDVSPGATLDLGATAQTIGGLSDSGTVDDEGTATLTIDDAINATFTGTLTGVPNINKKGAGTQILAPVGHFGLTSTINAGTLQIGNGGARENTFGNFTDNAQLAFNMSGSLAIFASYTVSGTGGVGFTGNYTFANSLLSYTGLTTINANSSLTLASGVTFAGKDIVDNGTLTITKPVQTIIGGKISGSGSLHVQSGDVVLNNALNTFSGGAFIDSGTLSTASDGAVDDSIVIFSNGANAAAWEATGFFANNAEFDITTGQSVRLEAVANGIMHAFFGKGGGAGTTLHIGSTTDTGEVFLSSAASLPTGGALSIDGGDVVVAGANAAALIGAMTAGVTVNGDLLLFGNSLTVNDLQGAGSIGDGQFAGSLPTPATLTVFDAASGSAFSGSINHSLSLIIAGSASIFDFTGDDFASTTINSGATLQLGDQTHSGFVDDDLVDNGIFDYFNSANTTFSHKLSGSGALYKDTANQLTLSGDDSGFNGTVSLDSGVLTLANATALSAAQNINIFGGALEAKVSATLQGSVKIGAATTFEATAGVTLSLAGKLGDSVGHVLHFGSAVDTGTVNIGQNGGSGFGSGESIEIDGGTLNVQSGLLSAGAPVSFAGTNSKLVLNSTSAAVAVSSVAGKFGEVDLNAAQVKFTGGGETVKFVSGAGDAATLSATNNVWDTVNGSSGAVTLTSSQASVVGGGDTVTLDGSASDAASLYGTVGNYDTVNGFNGSVSLTKAQASIVGGDDHVYLDGSSSTAASLYNTGSAWDTVTGSNGSVSLTKSLASIVGGGDYVYFDTSGLDYASLYNTGGSWDTVTGSKGNLYLTNAQTSVVGGGDAISLFGSAANSVSLYGTNGAFDTVTGANANISLTSAQASIVGGGDTVYLNGAGDIVSLYNTNQSYDTVNGASATIVLNKAQTSVVGGGDTINFDSSGVDAVSLYNTNGTADVVNAASGVVTLSSAQTKIVGVNDTIYMNGASTATETLTGSGHDAYIYQQNMGVSVINGFTTHDTMQLSKADFASVQSLFANNMSASNGNTIIKFDANDQITLTGILPGALSPSQFSVA